MPKYRFDAIAMNSTEKKKPTESDKDTYIGLEHLDSGALEVTRWGADVAPVGDKLVMKKGDVLFGRRRAYQKKVAIAPFDGIFSAHGMVLRPIETVVTKEFFPFFISSDSFLDAAIQISVGSLSPTINWRDLCKLEFEIPTIEEQKELAPILWGINRLKVAYTRLLLQMDTLVQSQFVEMFETGRYDSVEAGSVLHDMCNGLSPSTHGKYHAKVLTLSAVTQGEFDPTAWKDGTFDESPSQEKRIKASEFYMCRGNGNKTLVGRGVFSNDDMPELVFPDTVIAAQIDQSKVLKSYLLNAWRQDSVRVQIESAARTTNGTYKINQSIISKIRLVLPPIEVQKDFEYFANQTDKSKLAIRQTLESLENSRKAIMKKVFG